MMKIAILLPYKENYSKYNTGAVSIFVNGVNKISKFKNNIYIYGSTNFKPIFSGKPPTLWCDFIVTDGPPLNETDSITSGYKVP